MGKNKELVFVVIEDNDPRGFGYAIDRSLYELGNVLRLWQLLDDHELKLLKCYVVSKIFLIAPVNFRPLVGQVQWNLKFTVTHFFARKKLNYKRGVTPTHILHNSKLQI